MGRFLKKKVHEQRHISRKVRGTFRTKTSRVFPCLLTEHTGFWKGQLSSLQGPPAHPPTHCQQYSQTHGQQKAPPHTSQTLTDGWYQPPEESLEHENVVDDQHAQPNLSQPLGARKGTSRSLGSLSYPPVADMPWDDGSLRVVPTLAAVAPGNL